MSRRGRRPALAILGALVLPGLLAGCVDVDDEAVIADSGGVAGVPDVDLGGITPDPAVVALVPDEIAAAGVLTVGTDTTYAPAEFLAADGRTPVGYDVDLVTAIARTMGLDVDVRTAAFTSIIPSVGSRYDVGISSFTITPERMDAVTMISYFNAGEAVTVLAGNPEGVDPDHLCGLTVAVQTGTVEFDELPGLSDDCVAAGDPEITPLVFGGQDEVTTNLVGGRADAMYTDSPIAAYAIARTGDRLEKVGETFATADQGIVVAQDDPALADAVLAALESLQASGDYQRILDAWGNGEGAVDRPQINPEVEP
ncbi:polar amino acid transport system substrate-binding protein [Sediminihabitans luteus]|uniref:Polar amino acid transport system substrate-binding protein n=1 Tax=Sediminihabitans luteus TaxID=1138585 RepID=A0A2M9CDC8_9CELL|nr:ABC transporter substrate-binding protein [Sediminihabitans luteus]PJJ69301.1 polar amino acid transport system substrate-binding protein [Sediminihabitans luteus]GII98983.1 ABC transporter substrate-binding protein [Sediminihabitans luteus]